MKIEVVQKHTGYHLEGPHWDDVTQTLLYVDILEKNIHRYKPATKEAQVVNIGRRVGSVVTTRSGRTLAAAAHGIGYVDWTTGGFETIVEVEQDKDDTRFNDGKCDPAGRFLAGTMGFVDLPNGVDERAIGQGKGALYCLRPDKTLFTHLTDVDVSNGLAWTADHKTMYYIDSFKYRVDAFDYNVSTGQLANRRTAFTLPESEGIPDGMCIDSEDMLWVARFQGAAVQRFNPRTGEKLLTVKLPTDVITSCCWGGANLDELYVTASKLFLTTEQLADQDAAGSILRVTGLGVKGVKACVFNDV